jgi:hypothetical protein
LRPAGIRLDKKAAARHNAAGPASGTRRGPPVQGNAVKTANDKEVRPRGPARFGKAALAALKYGLGPGLLALVAWQTWSPADGSPGLADSMRRPVHALPLALAGAAALAATLLSFVRWFILVRAQDLPFRLADAVRLGFVGLFWSTLIPGSVGGDVVKAAFLIRGQDRRTVAVATILIDRLVGLAGLIWLVALLGGGCWAAGALRRLAATPQAGAALEAVVAGAALLAAGSLLAWLVLGLLPARRAEALAGRLAAVRRAGGPLAELWRAVCLYRRRGRSVGLALLLALAGHAGAVLLFFFAAATLCPADELPPLGAHFLLVPLGTAVQAGFPAPDGLGGAELAFGALYVEAGSTLASGMLGALVQRVVMGVLALAGYVVYLRLRPALRAAPPVVEAPAPPLARAG